MPHNIKTPEEQQFEETLRRLRRANVEFQLDEVNVGALRITPIAGQKRPLLLLPTNPTGNLPAIPEKKKDGKPKIESVKTTEGAFPGEFSTLRI